MAFWELRPAQAFEFTGEGVEIPSSSTAHLLLTVCKVCSKGAECREMPVLAGDKESRKPAGKCEGQEMRG